MVLGLVIVWLPTAKSIVSLETLAHFLLSELADLVGSIRLNCGEVLLAKDLLNSQKGHLYKQRLVNVHVLADLGQVLVFLREHKQGVQCSLVVINFQIGEQFIAIAFVLFD